MLFRSLSILVLVSTGAAASACPWSGGTFSGRDRPRGLSIDFTVNEACSEVNFQSVGSTGFQPVATPQDFAMKARYDYWEADINGARTTFASNGNWVEFFTNGRNLRVSVSP